MRIHSALFLLILGAPAFAQEADTLAAADGWRSSLAATLAGQDFSGYLSYITQRGAFALGQLPTTTTFTAAAGPVTANGATTVSGTANIRITAIEVNGLLYTPTWTSNWPTTS